MDVPVYEALCLAGSSNLIYCRFGHFIFAAVDSLLSFQTIPFIDTLCLFFKFNDVLDFHITFLLKLLLFECRYGSIRSALDLLGSLTSFGTFRSLFSQHSLTSLRAILGTYTTQVSLQ